MSSEYSYSAVLQSLFFLFAIALFLATSMVLPRTLPLFVELVSPYFVYYVAVRSVLAHYCSILPSDKCTALVAIIPSVH